MTSKNVSEDLTRQDRKLLSQLVEHMPFEGLETSEKQVFIEGKGGAAHWLAWQVKRYEAVKSNPNILLVDRSVKFNTNFVARGAFDSKHGTWKQFAVVPPSAQNNPEFDISKIHLRPINSAPWHNEYPLDARVLQTFLEQNDRIPKEWTAEINDKQVCIIFAGTRLEDTYGQDCYLVLRHISGRWHWDCFTQAKIQATDSDFSFVDATYDSGQ